MDKHHDPAIRTRRRHLLIGECLVDFSLNEVREAERQTRLAPKAAAVLEVLVSMQGQAVSKERLLSEVWRGECPTDDVVTNAVAQLRRAFGDPSRESSYIRTVHRVGYVLVAPVSRVDVEEATPASSIGQMDWAVTGAGTFAETEPRTPAVVDVPLEPRRWIPLYSGLPRAWHSRLPGLLSEGRVRRPIGHWTMVIVLLLLAVAVAASLVGGLVFAKVQRGHSLQCASPYGRISEHCDAPSHPSSESHWLLRPG